MRLGLLLNGEHEHTTLVRIARRAEALGYSCLWYADERFYRETYVGLAACAVGTTSIRLGTAVADPYTKHPALTAAAIHSLDELSNGRAMLGLGAGLSGFHNIGIRLEKPAATVRDAIEVIRRLGTGEMVTYDGERIPLKSGQMAFPVRANLPIYLAADGKFMLRLAGAAADGVIIMHCASQKILDPMVEEVDRGRREARREAHPELVARLDVSISADREAALWAAKVRLARYLWARYPSITYLAAHGLRLPGELDRRFRDAGPFVRSMDPRTYEPFADAIPEELIRPIQIAGTPGEVGERLSEVAAGGADEVMAYLLVPEGESIFSAMELLAAAYPGGAIATA